MKNFNYLLVLVQLLFILHMQAQDTTSLDEQVATATSLLPTADITTGLLYDRVPEYFPFKYLDGINTGDSVYLNKDRFQMSYGMIASTHIDSFTGIPIDSMWHLIEEFSEEEIVYFGGMYYNYHKIRGDAVDSGWITTDSTYYYDNTPQDTSLYEQKRLYGMSALKKYAAGPSITFYFDTTYLFTNIGFDTASIEVDFDDGNGWQNLMLNQYISINYSVLDTMKHIRVRMKDTVGQWIYAKSPLYVYAVFLNTDHDFSIEPDGVIRIGETRIFDDGTPCCDIKEFFDDDTRDIERLARLCEIRRDVPLHLERNTAMKNGIEIFFWQNDNCETPCHRKPLIIIEGFDPAEIYDYNLLFDDPQEEIDERGLMNQVYGMQQRLSEYINLEDYDLYFLNFGYKNNTDPIQDNAQWLKQAINEINTLKAECGSVEQNVIVGASMGGLVGRWALSEMEAEGIDHETELFISFDSPLKGANVPIGLQALINDLKNTKIWGIPLGKVNDGLEYGQRALNTPAAKQMLYYHRAASGEIINTNASTLTQFHSSFQSEFDQLELSIPHLAISNGSLLNQDQGYPERDHILDVVQHIGFLTQVRNGLIGWGARGILGDPCAGWPLNDEISQALDKLKNATDLLGKAKIWLDVWATPGKPNENQVYHKFMTTSGIFLPFVSWGYYNVDGLLPIDNAPGGTSRFASTEGSTNNLGFKEDFYSFVPTPSALGIDVPSNLHTNLEDVNTVLDNNNTIVREYRGSILDNTDNPNGFTNQEHVTLDRNSAVWWRYHTESMGLEDVNGEPITLLEEKFNFGEGPIRAPDNLDPANLIPRQMSNFIDNSLTVDGNGSIWVCGGGDIGFASDQNMPENEAESFELNIIRGFCEGDITLIDFLSGTSMVLGTTSGGDRSGIVNIEDDSKLHFWENTNLEMVEESELVITATALLNLKDGATAYLNNSSKIIIEEHGNLQIDAGAKVYLDNNSQIIVKAGAVLKLSTDAFIQLNGSQFSSKIVIEAGGTLHLEQLPLIHLEDQSSIEVHGSFITEGEVEIEAPNGFLDFHRDFASYINKRELGGKFRMNGSSRENLLIKFHNYSSLTATDNDFELYFGKVLIADKQGYIYTNGQDVGAPPSNGTFKLHDIHFQGQGDVVGGGNPYFNYDYDRALKLKGLKGLEIKNCIFENVTRGIDIKFSNSGEYRIENTKFKDVFIGLDAERVDNITVIDCKFKNPEYSVEQATAGMELKMVDDIYINSTDFVSFRCGIRVLEIPNGGLSNIHLLDCTEIIDCHIGLYGEDTYVKMDNSGLFYNKYGIAGINVELDIASSSAIGDKNVYVICKPSSGLTQPNQLALSDPDPDNYEPEVVDPPYTYESDICGWVFSIKNNSAGGQGGVIDAEYNYWSPVPLETRDHYFITHDGFEQIVEDDPRDPTQDDPVPGDCSDQSPPPPPPAREEQLESRFSEISKQDEIKIYPNPVLGNLFIEVSNDMELSIKDVSGKIVVNRTLLEGSHSIHTSNWQSGVYIVRVGSEYFKLVKQ